MHSEALKLTKCLVGSLYVIYLLSHMSHILRSASVSWLLRVTAVPCRFKWLSQNCKAHSNL